MSRLLGAPLAAVLLAAGCSTYDHRFVYDPRPADVGTAAPEVRALVSVMGLRRADRARQIPASLDLRLHLENAGSETVVFDPSSLVLFAADLTRLADPLVEPAGRRALAPGATMLVEARFALPASELDLDGLRLCWELAVGDTNVAASAGFTRRPEHYYDRYPHRIGVGFHRYDC